MNAQEKAAGVLDTPATADRKHCSASVAPTETPDNYEKSLATLRARACLAGVTLHAIEDDRGQAVCVVSRWALTRQLDSLDAVARWLDTVAGVRHG